MEMLWPRIGGLWSGAMTCLASLLNTNSPLKRDEVLALLQPAEAMFRRALVLLAYGQGIASFCCVPSFSLSVGGFGASDTGADEDKVSKFRLCEGDFGVFIGAESGKGDTAPPPPALPGFTSPPVDVPNGATQNILALQNRLEALDAALEDPFAHVKRMGRLLWRAGEDKTAPPVNLITGAMMTADAPAEAAELLSQLNARAQLAIWHAHPPP